MIKFPSIEQFRNVRRNVERKAQFLRIDENGEAVMDRSAKMPKISYRGTVKLHGTNAAVQVHDNYIVTQSRNNIITPENDNAGFARWAHSIPFSTWDALRKQITDKNIVLFGEWAGKGVQPKVAIAEVEKFFAIFAARDINEENGWFSIRNLNTPKDYRIYNVYDFGSYTIDIDFENPAEDVNKMNELTLAVEKECPAGKYFGVSGIGEGIVWRPMEAEYNDSRYWFKVKGGEHSNSKVTKLANVNVEKMKSIEDFVNFACNEGRLMQGYEYLKENKHELTEKSTGVFIQWIIGDILKEEKDTLTQNNLTEKQVLGNISKVARRWYFDKIK